MILDWFEIKFKCLIGQKLDVVDILNLAEHKNIPASLWFMPDLRLFDETELVDII